MTEEEMKWCKRCRFHFHSSLDWSSNGSLKGGLVMLHATEPTTDVSEQGRLGRGQRDDQKDKHKQYSKRKSQSKGSQVTNCARSSRKHNRRGEEERFFWFFFSPIHFHLLSVQISWETERKPVVDVNNQIERQVKDLLTSVKAWSWPPWTQTPINL